MHINNMGATTIEAAVIVPLFTMIVVMLIQTAINSLDKDILNCASEKLCMDVEFLEFKSGKYDKNKLLEYTNLGNTFLNESTVNEKNQIEIVEDIFTIKTEYGKVDKNNPVQYVRITDVGEKLLKKVKN